MGILGKNPKDEPLHYGEIFAIWTNVLGNNGMIAYYQTLYNHTGDEDLAKIIEEAIQGMQEENRQLTNLLKVTVSVFHQHHRNEQTQTLKISLLEPNLMIRKLQQKFLMI